MAVVAVGVDAARYDALDALTNVTSIGGGPGATVDGDIYYQNAAAISRKVTGAGFYTSTGAARDLTAAGRKTWLCKIWLTNFGSLSGSNYLEVRVGSSAGSAYYAYRIAGSGAAQAYPAIGGFVLFAIDPGVAGHRYSTLGSPALTAVNYFACYAVCSTSKVENLALDAVDCGYGLYLTGGDGGDTDGTFDDFVAADEGTATTGRYGFVTTREGIVYVVGRLVIGATSSSGSRSAAATGFTDNNKTLVFPDNWAAEYFSGFFFDLSNASTQIGLTACALISRGNTLRTENTRAMIDVSGTNGALALDACNIVNFRGINLTAGVTLTDCTILDVQSIALDGATLTGCAITTSLVGSGSVCVATTGDVENITDCVFDNGGTGHAILITTPGAYTLTDLTFLGYGADTSTDAAIFNDSGGHVELNISGGTTPTIRNGSGASTDVNATVTITFTGLVAGTEIRVFRTADDVEVAGTESTAGTTFAAGLAAGVSHYVHVLALGYLYVRRTGLSFTVTQNYPVNLQVDRNYANP